MQPTLDPRKKIVLLALWLVGFLGGCSGTGSKVDSAPTPKQTVLFGAQQGPPFWTTLRPKSKQPAVPPSLDGSIFAFDARELDDPASRESLWRTTSALLFSLRSLHQLAPPGSGVSDSALRSTETSSDRVDGTLHFVLAAFEEGLPRGAIEGRLLYLTISRDTPAGSDTSESGEVLGTRDDKSRGTRGSSSKLDSSSAVREQEQARIWEGLVVQWFGRLPNDVYPSVTVLLRRFYRENGQPSAQTAFDDAWIWIQPSYMTLPELTYVIGTPAQDVSYRLVGLQGLWSLFDPSMITKNSAGIEHSVRVENLLAPFKTGAARPGRDEGAQSLGPSLARLLQTEVWDRLSGEAYTDIALPQFPKSNALWWHPAQYNARLTYRSREFDEVFEDTAFPLDVETFPQESWP